jgi:hypothetical protein
VSGSSPDGLKRIGVVRQGRGRKPSIAPENAIVLAMDEKSQNQALDRTPTSSSWCKPTKTETLQ